MQDGRSAVNHVASLVQEECIAVAISVFVNEAESQGGTREFRSVNVQRSYRDGDETRFTSSFTLSELPLAIRVLQLAQEHVEAAEATGAAG